MELIEIVNSGQAVSENKCVIVEDFGDFCGRKQKKT